MIGRKDVLFDVALHILQVIWCWTYDKRKEGNISFNDGYKVLNQLFLKEKCLL